MDQQLYNCEAQRPLGRGLRRIGGDFVWRSSNISQRVCAPCAAGGWPCCGAALLSLCLGAAALSPQGIAGGLWAAGGARLLPAILLYVRVPRTVGCLLAGAALAVSGAIIQTVLANPLAAPNIIGVNSGAGLGVALCCAVLAHGG